MPVLSRDDLRKQLGKKEFAPVYTMFGAETFLRDAAAKYISDQIMKDAPLREFNESFFSLNDSEIRHALAVADQIPMIAEKRLVKVTELNISDKGQGRMKEADEETLARYVVKPAASCILILVVDELDKRKKLAKTLLENTVAVEFTALKDSEIKAEAQKILKKLNASADDDALRHLIALVGNDLRTISNELNKLATAAMPDGRISFKLVEELSPNSRELSNFDLTDHLIAKNRRRALPILQKLLDDGAEPLMLLGLIASNYRRLTIAKAMMKQGLPNDDVFRAAGVPPFKRQEFLETARRADLAHLSFALERLATADLGIKTSKATPRLQIEMLVLELTA